MAQLTTSKRKNVAFLDDPSTDSDDDKTQSTNKQGYKIKFKRMPKITSSTSTVDLTSSTDTFIDLTELNLITCVICYNKFEKHFLPCNHSVCVNCVLTNLLTQINQNMVPTKTCPLKDCRDKFLRLFSIPIATNEQKQDLLKIRTAIGTSIQKVCANKKVFNCPNRSCSDYVKLDNVYINKKCSFCAHDVCQFCGDSAHEPGQCYSWLSPMTAPCPNCRTIVSKDCYAATTVNCIRCGHSWFWCCDNYWRPTHSKLYEPGLKMTLAKNRIVLSSNLLSDYYINKIKNLIVLPQPVLDKIIKDFSYLTVVEINFILHQLAKIDDIVNRLSLISKYVINKGCIGIIDLDFAIGETVASQNVSLDTMATIIDNKIALLQHQHNTLNKK